MIHYESKQLIQKSKVYFLIKLFELGFKQHYILVFTHIPNISEIVYSLAPLIDKQRRRL